MFAARVQIALPLARWGFVLLFAWPYAITQAAELRVDFARTNGLIRPLHGVNLGPLCYRGSTDVSAYHRELGVPLTRLHDVVWVNAEAVDIHTIFRDFRDDPQQPENYFFAPTDDYVQSILSAGSQIVYRLGESIEHTPRKYWVHPPPDPDKWAAVCVNIIRHYNEGWAGGFRHNIRYWEIWNEPDVRPSMWTGTDAQFFRLYEVTAKAIKARCPDVKVGGPAVGGTGDFTGSGFQPAVFLTNFLAYCRQHDAPVDFFSWHRYTSNPWDLPRRAQAMRNVLNEYGFTRTESHLNEWNFLPNDDWRPMLKEGQGKPREAWYAQMSGPQGAAFTAAGLLLLQDSPLDVANYYTGDLQGFGLFNIHGTPKKAYYAVKAFRQLLDTPLRVEATGAREGTFAAAAGLNQTHDRASILIAQFKASSPAPLVEIVNLPWPGDTLAELWVVNAEHDLACVATHRLGPSSAHLKLELPAPSVVLIQMRKATG